jgi:myo-inositol-1(or 4)-monophosphatase
MLSSSRANDLLHVRWALESLATMISDIKPGGISVSYSHTGDPVTALDRAINQHLRESLPREGESWLSEESRDDLSRLNSSRVWVVDPIDGTREYVEVIPMWCVSIGLVEDHCAVAGGILNPSTNEMFLGSMETGLEVLGRAKVESPIERTAPPHARKPQGTPSGKMGRV